MDRKFRGAFAPQYPIDVRCALTKLVIYIDPITKKAAVVYHKWERVNAWQAMTSGFSNYRFTISCGEEIRQNNETASRFGSEFRKLSFDIGSVPYSGAYWLKTCSSCSGFEWIQIDMIMRHGISISH